MHICHQSDTSWKFLAPPVLDIVWGVSPYGGICCPFACPCYKSSEEQPFFMSHYCNEDVERTRSQHACLNQHLVIQFAIWDGRDGIWDATVLLLGCAGIGT